ncbi:hypothetical protein IGB42_01790 [Andreprevotia sp. IGB-42]|uniref:hypothetical protein n=1 Tax=Andreprevotia sp. IGB-42 TaxID=2497473 RepID=UPI001357A3C8|nr:hypothetical protein [Andreprevotia sp. IGB-42]KAF0813439.1 hypothetical protein IGB42_01790 [Andreprevotia sp. IGB-42]
MSTPTPDQIALARSNLSILRELNEEACLHHLPKILNAYALLVGNKDESDPGIAFLLEIFQGLFSALGAEVGGGAGKAAAGFVAGLVANWISAPPSSLNTQFASYATRYDATVRALSLQLDTINANLGSSDAALVQQTWDSKVSYNGITTAVADFAAPGLPKVKEDPLFDHMVDKVTFSQDQALWKQMLIQNYQALYYTWYHRGQAGSPPLSWSQYRLSFYKYCYYTYYTFQAGYEPPFYLWCVNEYVVCRKGTVEWYYLNGDACDYLFIDSTPGTIINPNGLFGREEVVQFLGIVHVETEPYVTIFNPPNWRDPKRNARPDVEPVPA